MSEKESLASLMRAAFPQMAGPTDSYPDNGYSLALDGWPPLTIFVDDNGAAFVAARLIPLSASADVLSDLLLRLLELNQPGNLPEGNRIAALDGDAYLVKPLDVAAMQPEAFKEAISAILSLSGALAVELRELASALEDAWEDDDDSDSLPAPAEPGFGMGSIRV